MTAEYIGEPMFVALANPRRDTRHLALQPTDAPPLSQLQARVLLADAVMATFAPEGRHVDSECCGRLAESRTVGEHAQDMLALEVFQPYSMRAGNGHTRNGMSYRIRQVVERYRFGSSQGRGSQQGIVELADVAGPSIVDQRFGRMRRQ